MVGERLEVEHLLAALGERAQQQALARAGGAADDDEARAVAGSVSSAATTARAERLVAAFEQVDAKADLRQHQASELLRWPPRQQ